MWLLFVEMLQNFGTLWTQAAWYSHFNWILDHLGFFVCFVFVFHKEYSPAPPSLRLMLNLCLQKMAVPEHKGVSFKQI